MAQQPWQDDLRRRLEEIGGWGVDIAEEGKQSRTDVKLTETIILPQAKYEEVMVIDGVFPPGWCEKFIKIHSTVTPQHDLDVLTESGKALEKTSNLGVSYGYSTDGLGKNSSKVVTVHSLELAEELWARVGAFTPQTVVVPARDNKYSREVSCYRSRANLPLYALPRRAVVQASH